VLPIPAFGPKLLLGADVANTLLFTGQRVVPSRLLDDGFSFRYPTLDAALRGLLGR
jgi:NAD dependent epimerase/dehydratase family enzyme